MEIRSICHSVCHFDPRTGAGGGWPHRYTFEAWKGKEVEGAFDIIAPGLLMAIIPAIITAFI